MVPPYPLLSLTCPGSGVFLRKTLTETPRTRIPRGWVGVQHLPNPRGYQRIINHCQPVNNHYQLLIVGGGN